MDIFDVSNYEALLEEASRFHGDTCPGIQIGTRMTMCGLRNLGISDPKGRIAKSSWCLLK